MDWLTDTSSALQNYEWGVFFRSPGFGGVAAVGAALMAYAGVRRTLNLQRETTRKQQWWDRARWALDLTLVADVESRVVGYSVLDALATSEYAAEHEVELIADAAERPLEAYEEQFCAPDESGTGDVVFGEADSTSDGTTTGDAP